MKYFVLLAGYGELPTWDELSPEEQQAGMERHEAFARACEDRAGGELRLQAAAARDHAVAPNADATDWTAIESCYAELERVKPARRSSDSTGPSRSPRSQEPAPDSGRSTIRLAQLPDIAAI